MPAYKPGEYIKTLPLADAVAFTDAMVENAQIEPAAILERTVEMFGAGNPGIVLVAGAMYLRGLLVVAPESAPTTPDKIE